MSNHSKDVLSPWQTAPADILVLILETLVRQPCASYIPLTCIHVCRHWRQVVTREPLLWTYVDVARGDPLTQLWLSYSANSPIDVKIWQPPEVPHKAHTILSNIVNAIEHTKWYMERWASLDISFWCLECLRQLIAHIGSLKQAIALESLTIGPMGGCNALLPACEFGVFSGLMFVTSTVLKATPSILRMDSFPPPMRSELLSPRLRTIEIFSEPIRDNFSAAVGGPFFWKWSTILRATPNLVSLTLWHQSSKGEGLFENAPESHPPGLVSLPRLEHLSLNSRYLELCTMLSLSPLPSLKSLRLDSSVATSNVPLYVSRVAAVAPRLSKLAVSHVGDIDDSAETWGDAFGRLCSLKQLTLFEMDESMALSILELPNLPKTITEICLERICLTRAITWPPTNLVSDVPPRLTIVGYNSNFAVSPAASPSHAVCCDSTERPTGCEDVARERVLYSQESNLYTIKQDLAVVRAPISEPNQYENESSDELEDCSDEDNSYKPDHSSEDESSCDSGSEASFASGTFVSSNKVNLDKNKISHHKLREL